MGAPMWESDRQAAAQWARGLLDAPVGRVLVLDTETTSLDGFLVELAVTDLTGRAVLAAQFDPGTDIGPRAAAIHGLSAELVAGMPEFGEVAATLAHVLRGRTVVVYNSAFEIKILRNEVARLGTGEDFVRRSLNAARWECAMLRYAAFVGEWNDFRGDYRWQRLPGGDHTALGDCRATIDVLREMGASATSPADDGIRGEAS